MDRRALAARIEHTLLEPGATDTEVEALIRAGAARLGISRTRAVLSGA